MMTMTLILKDKTLYQVEYNYLICSRVSTNYLMDLYSLFKGINANTQILSTTIGTVTMMLVDEIIDPEEWLHCIKWTRYRRLSDSRKSLEWFIARPTQSRFYYSIGEDGTVLVCSKPPQETLVISRDTVQTVLGESGKYCQNPTFIKIDWNNGKSNNLKLNELKQQNN